MAKVSREVLKSFFQTGNKPAGTQYASLIDSMLHYSADRDLLGLREYNTANIYFTGDTVVHTLKIYQANKQTTGTFAAADWNLLGSTAPTSVFGADYEMAQEPELTFTTDAGSFTNKLQIDTNSRSGLYRLQWSALIAHDSDGGTGSFQLNEIDTGVLGGTQIITQAQPTDFIPIGGLSVITLNGSPTEISIQYKTNIAGQRQYIKNAYLEIFRVG